MSYKQLDPQDFLVSADSITAPCWSGYTQTLDLMFTSSIQTSGVSGDYYINVYNLATTDEASEVQFNIAFGNKFGSGSSPYDANYPNLSPTRAVYGQWRNLVYGDENTNFTFGSVTPARQSIYILSIDRARYKQSILPGSLNLTLYTSTNQEMTLTDDSAVTTTVSYCDAGRVYQLVSGSNGTPISTNNGYTADSGSYGLLLPDIGAIILNADALDLSYTNKGVALATSLATNANNPSKLYNRLRDTSFTGSFQLNSQETVTSDFVFCRARNSEFNYSENPSFISGSTGAVLYDLFVNSPTTYITTVGLYNNSNELLAVAKLSKPLPKDFTKEALVRVKLDF
jgi:hypothetical protein